ncbi:MAG: hypothetical protein DMG40_07335 [Acidobacteria bacterium]|nr:MAG: hypothetical protein DMG40_07335 [Acidobacteriota bacterium]
MAIPDRLDIQQSMDHHADLRIYRPSHLFALPSNPPPHEAERATRHVAFIIPSLYKSNYPNSRLPGK